ncbi:hypothetical protein CUMW_173710 [Citrus unshiu]|nr:hypothetical protein CUMW_173710 [Citrus unshiu]
MDVINWVIFVKGVWKFSVSEIFRFYLLQMTNLYFILYAQNQLRGEIHKGSLLNQQLHTLGVNAVMSL